MSQFGNSYLSFSSDRLRAGSGKCFLQYLRALAVFFRGYYIYQLMKSVAKLKFELAFSLSMLFEMGMQVRNLSTCEDSPGLCDFEKPVRAVQSCSCNF